MVHQIVRKKKKGRPSKADLARRLAAGESQEPPEIRRSHRRRNARFGVIDYDDFIDEDDEEEEEFLEEDDDEEEDEDERLLLRREKKLRLVVKLSRDEALAAAAAAAASEDEDSDGERTRKKRRINGGDEIEEEEEEEVEEDEVEEDDEDEEERTRKVGTKRLDSVLPGTPIEARTSIPLPDKKILEMILDKLQKKDTYGVYAEPVDPEELPDYHDVIEHPMDFATVRNRLSDGTYSTLEQLESDIFLICSNAMQYNSSDTVYHKQARAIQELARKKFEKLRIKFANAEKERKLAQKIKTNSMVINKFESSEEEMKPVQKIKSNSSVKKQIRKPMYRTSQETVGSDFSSGATLATAGEILNSMNLPQAGGCDKSTNNDVIAEIFNDVNLEKTEETSPAKGSYPPKLGRKPSNLEDNRRSTYNISNQPVEKPDSVFTTFESEIKQLVAVGLHAEYAYARSLARFAATLGPIAWKAASQKIEHALPSGYKFGRGWVGEYEPLPTPVLLLESNHKQKHSGETRKNEIGINKTPVLMKEKADIGHSVPTRVPQAELKTVPQSEAKPRKSQNQNAPARKIPKPEIVSPRHVELNESPTPNHKKSDTKSEKPFSRNRNPEMAAPRHVNVPESNGIGCAARLPNGKDPRSPVDRRMTGPPSEDHIQVLKVFGEKAQQKPLDQTPLEAQRISPNNNNNSNNAAAAAARAWMSIGAGAFPKTQTTSESQPQSHSPIGRILGEFPGSAMHHQFHPEMNGYPIPAPFYTQPVVRFGSESTASVAHQHFQNLQTRPAIMFPQVAPADLSRFQMQSPTWHGLNPHNHNQPRQKQDNLPPDLNIGFQPPPQSPAKQPAGVMVESQQPDLALQL